MGLSVKNNLSSYLIHGNSTFINSCSLKILKTWQFNTFMAYAYVFQIKYIFFNRLLSFPFFFYCWRFVVNFILMIMFIHIASNNRMGSLLRYQSKYKTFFQMWFISHAKINATWSQNLKSWPLNLKSHAEVKTIL